jgi:uncharacterized protein DUF1707
MTTATIRASDAEREQVTRLLQQAVAEGRLTPEEAGERLAAASAARFRDELGRLVEDLPAMAPALPRPARGAVWLGVAARLTRGLVFAAVAVAVFGFWGIRFLLPIWVIGFVAFGLAARAGRRRAAWWHTRGWSPQPRWLGPSERPW